jgi:hypothetical protein
MDGNSQRQGYSTGSRKPEVRITQYLSYEMGEMRAGEQPLATVDAGQARGKTGERLNAMATKS